MISACRIKVVFCQSDSFRVIAIQLVQSGLEAQQFVRAMFADEGMVPNAVHIVDAVFVLFGVYVIVPAGIKYLAGIVNQGICSSVFFCRFQDFGQGLFGKIQRLSRFVFE